MTRGRAGEQLARLVRRFRRRRATWHYLDTSPTAPTMTPVDGYGWGICLNEQGDFAFDRGLFFVQRPRRPDPNDPHVFWPDTAPVGNWLYENPLGTGEPEHIQLLATGEVDPEGMVTMSTDIGPIRICADTPIHRLSWELAAMKNAILDACIEHDRKTGPDAP